MQKHFIEAMLNDSTAADWARVPKSDIIARVLDLENTLAEKARVDSALMAERAELTEKLENANMMLSARSTELERSQKIAAEMSATVAKQRDEIRECNAEIIVARKNTNDLKSRLAYSEFRVARLEGTLERVREGDRLRLTAMGRLPRPDDRPRFDNDGAMTAAGVRDDTDWVTF